MIIKFIANFIIKFMKVVLFPYRCFKYGFRDWNTCCCYKNNCFECNFFKKKGNI